MKQFIRFASIAVLLGIVVSGAFGQVSGDYRTVAGLPAYNATTMTTTVWSNVACWEKYNGTTWSAASTIPTTTANVTIVSGDTLYFDQSTTITLASLKINDGGSLIIPGGGVDCNVTVSGSLTGSSAVNFTVTGNITCSGPNANVKFGSNGAKITGVTGKTFTLANGATLTPATNNGAPPGTGNIITLTLVNMTFIIDNSAALTTVLFKNSGTTSIQNPPNSQVYGNLGFTTSSGAGPKTISFGENIAILGNLLWVGGSTTGIVTGDASAWTWNLGAYKIRTLGNGKTVTVSQISNSGIIITGTADTLFPGFSSYNFVAPSNSNTKVSYTGANQVVFGGTYQRLAIAGTGDFPLTAPATVKDTLILTSGNLNNSVYQVTVYRAPVITGGTISRTPITTGVEELKSSLPEQYALQQNYPNPFNPATTIEYAVPQQSHVTLKIFDLLGREAAVLVNGRKESGGYSVQWNAAAMPSGIYFYRLQAGSFTETKRMILMK
ncbi:MAG: T9SS type A sorting domain-containing protein [Ignavibacteriales bacterium]|nr:T9SS type A sorting domain-containing protein [Ignavibacteriales bacterium]